VLQKDAGRARRRLWWCVTGQLSFLPIHAAGDYRSQDGDCTADYVVSSYIPTLTSLSRSRKKWQPLSRTDVTGLIICEPSAPGMSALSEVTQEVRFVRDCFQAADASVIDTPSTTSRSRELAALMSNTPMNILHLACHGVQDPDPLKSAFLLRDGRFTIGDIMQLDMSHAVLAYLSACQTAKGDRNAPDQAVHLAASMLFCGFKSVIGTMWSEWFVSCGRTTLTVMAGL
jgi:CHAT domain-containing protein